MARESKCRKVAFMPPVKAFKPVGIPLKNLEEIVFKVEEIEAIRLKNHLSLEQEECAQMMEVSRPTFQRILTEAYAKVADAFTNGKAIRIEGGSYCLGQGHCRRRERQLDYMEGCPFYDEGLDLTHNERATATSNRIAVCATGSQPSDQIHARFGRCTQFLLWDPETNVFSTLIVQTPENGQRHGTVAANLLIRAGIKALIVDHIGPKAFMLLQRANIHVYAGASNRSVLEAVNMLQAQQLLELESANG